MSKIKIFVVEDDPMFVNQLEMYIDELGYWYVGNANNTKDAVERIAAIQPDLILMDINLKDGNDGVTIAERIKTFNQAPIIFISSFTDEATYERVKSVLPIAFLNKPISKIKLKRTIELIVNQLSTLSITQFSCPVDIPTHISIKSLHNIERVELLNLLSIEVLDKHCKLTLVDRELMVRTPLKDLMKHLPAQLFIQTHRSFLVNLKHIKRVNLTDQVVLLTNEAIVPLSRSYREPVIEKLNVV